MGLIRLRRGRVGSSLLLLQSEDHPLFIYLRSGIHLSGTGEGADGHRLLSYGAAYRTARGHAACLGKLVGQHIADFGCSDGGGGDTGIEVDVIVAYIGANSADYLLSVLGCFDLALDPGRWQTGPPGHASRRIRVRPALLNHRWTASEMAKALEVKGTTTSAKSIRGGIADAGMRGKAPSGRHLTIFFHGPGYAEVARDAARHLVKKGGEGKSCLRGAGNHPLHVAVVAEIPALAEAVLLGKGEEGLQDKRNVQVPSSSPDVDAAKAFAQSNDEEGNGDSESVDAVILFTSGTSSIAGAKGVKLSHRSLQVQAQAKLGPPCLYSDRTRMVATTVPLFHVGGLSSALAVVLAGGALLYPAQVAEVAIEVTRKVNAGFQPDTVLSSLAGPTSSVWAANTLVVVPAMVHSLLKSAESDIRCHLSIATYPNVRLILVGGQSLTTSQLDRCQKVFPGARVVQTYACTEAGSSITFADLLPHRRTPGVWSDIQEANNSPNERAVASSLAAGPPQSTVGGKYGDAVGLPPDHVELRIFPEVERTRPEHASPAVLRSINKPYTLGIIGTRGPHVMNGYWRRGHETGDSLLTRTFGQGLTPEGWLLTNDRGFLDHGGNLYFAGRSTDTVRTGGETVAAPEVERTVQLHPAVDQCAVFGLPDDKFGEVVCVALVPASTLTPPSYMHITAKADLLSVAEVRRHCNEKGLASYKRPRRVFVVKDLPRNASGKVLKHQLVERFGPNTAGPRSRL